MGRLTEIVNNVATNGSVFKTTQVGAGSMHITNASIDVDVTVADYVSVTQSGNYIATKSYPEVTSTKYEGIHIDSSGIAAATNFSGTMISDGTRWLKGVTVYGGLDDDDFVHVSLSGTALAEIFIASGIWTKANSSHNFICDEPNTWTSGAKLEVFVDNNTNKDASVNISVEWME